MTVNQNKPLVVQEPASPIEVDWPPVLSDFPSGRYAISGSKWLLVPPDTTREDLPRYMVVKPARSQLAPRTEAREWKVRGSKGSEYIVTAHGADSRQIFFSCTCVGYGFRRKCKHIEGIKENIR